MGKIVAEHLIVKVPAIGMDRHTVNAVHLSLAQTAGRSTEVM